MAKAILEQHCGGFLLYTVKKFACGLNRNDKDWEPAKPMSLFFQSDYDFPSLASTLGHQVTCCGRTDGTVDCPVHGTTASSMILAASDWLCENEGLFSGRNGSAAYELLTAFGEWGC